MRSIIVTRHEPWPPTGGVQLRNWQNLSCLARLGEADLLTVHAGEGAAAPPNVAQSFLARPRNRKRGFVEQRRWWVETGVHPLARSLVQTEAAAWLERRIAASSKPVVLFEEVWLAPYLDIAKRAGATIVYDAHNVERDLRASALKPASGLLGRLRGRMLDQRLFEIEQRLVTEADVVWACSERDATRLCELYQRSQPIHVVPNTIDPTACAGIRELPQPATGHNIVFAATYSYPPNVEATRFLLDELYPRLLRADPAAELFLVGRDDQPWMREAALRSPGIHVTGAVESVEPYLAQADVVVAPLFQGSGTRLKIVEAFSAKRPVVSTRKGAEGLDVVDGEHLFLREDADSMVAAIVSLWSSPAQRERLTTRAFELYQERYSWDAAERAIRTSLEPLGLVASDQQLARHGS